MNKVEYWRSYFLDKYGDEYSFMTYKLKFDKLYRGRSFSRKTVEEVQEAVKYTKHIWSPPRKQCTKQRCNQKGQPLLYLSSHISSIPLELESEKDDLISIIEYRQEKHFEPLSIVGWADLIKIPSNGFADIIRNHFKDKSERTIGIDKKISKLFKNPKRESEKFDIYDITIGITQLFLKNLSIGVIYPSVAAGYESFNIVLKPQLVKSILKPFFIGIYKVVEINPVVSVDFIRISIGEIFENGEIHWKKDTSDNLIRYEKSPR